MKRVLVATKGWDGRPWATRLRQALPEHDVITADRDGRWPGGDHELATVDYVLAWNAPQETLDAVARPKVLISLGAGVDHLISRRLPAGVPIVRIVDPDMTARMAEYVMWQVLHHHRQAPVYTRQQRRHAWKKPGQWPAGAVSVGILGLGVLGQAAADVLLKLGFRVRGWSRSEKALPGVLSFGAAALDEFLAGTDILVSLLPLTPETTGFVDRSVFLRLQRSGPLGGPVYINAGRGRTHVEADVIAALTDGTLKGASLDVFEREPLPDDSPLWDMRNVVITPHVAADSDPDALVWQIAEQILRFERGEPLKNLVDPKLGY